MPRSLKFVGIKLNYTLCILNPKNSVKRIILQLSSLISLSIQHNKIVLFLYGKSSTEFHSTQKWKALTITFKTIYLRRLWRSLSKNIELTFDGESCWTIRRRSFQKFFSHSMYKWVRGGPRYHIKSRTQWRHNLYIPCAVGSIYLIQIYTRCYIFIVWYLSIHVVHYTYTFTWIDGTQFNFMYEKNMNDEYHKWI